MIVQNAVICTKCGEFIFSMHRHAYVECKCGNIAVDGGQEYIRRVGKGVTDRSFIDHSWSIETDIYQECADAAQQAMDTKRNKYGIANAVLRALRNHNRVVGEEEQRIMAFNPSMKEVMVVEPDGTVNRYKKVEE